MPKCFNCNYELVLLSSRPKYKCAICSKLYPKKEVEAKEFRRWNESQREKDKKGIELKHKKKKTLLNEKKIGRTFRLLFKQHRIKLNPEERIERKKERDKNYYYAHREEIIKKKKILVQKTKEQYNAWKRQYRQENLDTIKLKDQIQYYRKQQKALAVRWLENEQYKVSSIKLEPSLSTCPLSYLLRKEKNT